MRETRSNRVGGGISPPALEFGHFLLDSRPRMT